MLLLIGAGCAVPTTPFGASVNLKISATVTYADGLEVTLEKINDSRCPQGVQCIWAGELAPVLRLQGGSLASETELTLGTVRGLTGTAGDYSVTLSDVTGDAIVAVVTKRLAR